jgi:ribA/ribD-fused uncharacterized protein
MEQEFKGIKYMFFWNGIFSNWYESYFDINGIRYNCGEQYMMHQKAITFNDQETANKILRSSSPSKQKKLGREVSNFNPKQWDLVKYELVKTGLREKFNQNPKLKTFLLKYKDFQIVESSPEDRIWGIGFYGDEAIENIQNWGENLLGKVLTDLAIEST